MIFLLVVATAMLGFVGDAFVNQWAKTHDLRWLIASIPFWLSTATMFGLTLQQRHYAFSVALIIILLLHSGLVLAWDLLHEGTVLTPGQWAGVVVGLIAIILLETSGR